MGRNLNDFYRRLQNPGTGDPAQFEIASPYRFNVDIFITKPALDECKIANHKVFDGEHLSLAVRGIKIPDIMGTEDPSVSTHTGFMSLPDNSRTYTSENEVTIRFINSVFAPHENFFFNWLRETRAYTWQYNDFPFCKANIHVVGYPNSDEGFNNGDVQTDFTGRPVVKYTFIDAFPSGIETMDYEHMAQDRPERSVTFRFNYMTVNDQKLSTESFRDNTFDSKGRTIVPISITQ